MSQNNAGELCQFFLGFRTQVVFSEGKKNVDHVTETTPGSVAFFQYVMHRLDRLKARRTRRLTGALRVLTGASRLRASRFFLDSYRLGFRLHATFSSRSEFGLARGF